MNRRSPGAYARAIERCWVGAVGRAVVLSPREWQLIDDWYERSIPLAIVEEAIQQAVTDRGKRGAPPPRALGYVAPAVEEAWGAVVDGRRLDTASAGPDPRGGAAQAPAYWRRCLVRQRPESVLGSLLGELLEQHANGADAEGLDRRLDSALPTAVDPELLAGTEREVDRQLAGFRDRMEAGVFAATRRRAVVTRLRRALELPELGGREATSPAPD